MHPVPTLCPQDKYRLQYGQYSGKAGDALAGGGGMVEQWSACLRGMQFSTRDQVRHPPCQR